MNKFLKNLSNSDDKLLSRRAESVNTRAKMMQENLISKIKLEIEERKLKLQDLTEMGPDTTTSLVPTSANFDPQKWVNQVQTYKLDMYNLTVQLKQALETYNEFFKDEE